MSIEHGTKEKQASSFLKRASDSKASLFFLISGLSGAKGEDYVEWEAQRKGLDEVYPDATRGKFRAPFSFIFKL